MIELAILSLLCGLLGGVVSYTIFDKYMNKDYKTYNFAKDYSLDLYKSTIDDKKWFLTIFKNNKLTFTATLDDIGITNIDLYANAVKEE